MKTQMQNQLSHSGAPVMSVFFVFVRHSQTLSGVFLPLPGVSVGCSAPQLWQTDLRP